MADSSSVGSGAAQGAVAGAMIGNVVPGIGTAAGALAGGVLGSITGAFKKKRKTPARASGSVYGYDAYGNLVNKGSYVYNPSTGQYELKAGELSGAERAMRQNLGQSIASLINTVGTTPDAFVRYAKELSDSYYKQGERKLTEQYDKYQAQLDESLARRGLSTSRAAADLTSELQGKRLNTLADIYDAARRYGYDVQSGLQGQARSALSTLAGYQGQLTSQDQSYLQQALQAQQLGQQYENMKAGIANQNIAESNQNWQNILDAGTSIASSLAFANAMKGAQAGNVVAGVNDDLTKNIQQYGAQNAPWSTFGGYYG